MSDGGHAWFGDGFLGVVMRGLLAGGFGLVLVLAGASAGARPAQPAASSPRPANALTPMQLHVQRYPGGGSSSVRAYLGVGAETRTGPRRPAAAGSAADDSPIPLHNVQMNTDSTPPVPQNETNVTYKTGNPLVAIAASNDYVANNMAIMRTTDGGRTWSTYRQTPEYFPTRDACTASDPWLAYSLRDRAFYIVTLCFFRSATPSEVQVWKSVDDGLTWTPSRLASVPATNFDASSGTTDASVFLDNNQIVVDNNPASPHYGRIYVTYVKFHMQPSGFSDFCPVELSYTDAIPTVNPQSTLWHHTPVVPDRPAGNGVGEGANQWPRPQVAPNGNLDVTYALEDCNTGLDRGLRFQQSKSGGATFLAHPVRIDKPGQFRDNPDLADLLPPTAFRAPISPSLDVNQRTGTLTYLYQNNVNRAHSGADISEQQSRDGGRTWTDMKYLATENGRPARNDQFFPAVDSSPNGLLSAIWFDRRRDPANHDIDTWQAVSTNDGRDWRQFRISTRSWNPDESFFTCGCFIGDYNGLAVANQVRYPVWTDGRRSAIDHTGIGETDIFTNVEIGAR